jgi:hypothetical protein
MSAVTTQHNFARTYLLNMLSMNTNPFLDYLFLKALLDSSNYTYI